VAPSRGTCDVRYSLFFKKNRRKEGWVERQTQGYCNNKEKTSSPVNILQEEGVSMTNWRRGGSKCGWVFNVYTETLDVIIYI